MKKKLYPLFVALLLLTTGSAFAQVTWKQINTEYAGHTVKDFKFLPEFAWYQMEGSNSLIKGIYKSKDDGQTWNRTAFPVSPGGVFDAFKGICYFDSLTAIITYYDAQTKRNNFYETADGGTTQTFLSDTVFSDYKNSGLVAASPCETSGLIMLDENFGYGYTFASYIPTNKTTYLITVTTDGAKTWKNISLVFSGIGGTVRDIQFISSSIGFLAIDLSDGTRTLLKTTDGGDTWNSLFTYTYWIRKVHFVNENTGYVVKDGPNGFKELIKTTDAGLNWTVLFDDTQQFLVRHYAYNAKYSSVTDLEFSDENNGIVSGLANSGYIIIRTSDGGLNWSVDSVVTTDGEYSILKTQMFGNAAARGIYKNGLYGEGSIPLSSEIKENSADNFKIYPNPSAGSFSLRLKQSDDPALIKITDLYGKEIWTGAIPPGTERKDLYLRHKPGIYFLQWVSGKQAEVQKLILE